MRGRLRLRLGLRSRQGFPKRSVTRALVWGGGWGYAVSFSFSLRPHMCRLLQSVYHRTIFLHLSAASLQAFSLLSSIKHRKPLSSPPSSTSPSQKTSKSKRDRKGYPRQVTVFPQALHHSISPFVSSLLQRVHMAFFSCSSVRSVPSFSVPTFFLFLLGSAFVFFRIHCNGCRFSLLVPVSNFSYMEVQAAFLAESDIKTHGRTLFGAVWCTVDRCVCSRPHAYRVFVT